MDIRFFELDEMPGDTYINVKLLNNLTVISAY